MVDLHVGTERQIWRQEIKTETESNWETEKNKTKKKVFVWLVGFVFKYSLQ